MSAHDWSACPSVGEFGVVTLMTLDVDGSKEVNRARLLRVMKDVKVDNNGVEMNSAVCLDSVPEETGAPPLDSDGKVLAVVGNIRLWRIRLALVALADRVLLVKITHAEKYASNREIYNKYDDHIATISAFQEDLGRGPGGAALPGCESGRDVFVTTDEHYARQLACSLNMDFEIENATVLRPTMRWGSPVTQIGCSRHKCMKAALDGAVRGTHFELSLLLHKCPEKQGVVSVICKPRIGSQLVAWRKLQETIRIGKLNATARGMSLTTNLTEVDVGSTVYINTKHTGLPAMFRCARFADKQFAVVERKIAGKRDMFVLYQVPTSDEMAEEMPHLQVPSGARLRRPWISAAVVV